MATEHLPVTEVTGVAVIVRRVGPGRLPTDLYEKLPESPAFQAPSDNVFSRGCVLRHLMIDRISAATRFH